MMQDGMVVILLFCLSSWQCALDICCCLGGWAAGWDNCACMYLSTTNTGARSVDAQHARRLEHALN